jgi:ribosomal protein S18 acetylase RimI-like enzyme
MNVEIRILGPADLPLLDCVDDDVFDNTPDRDLAATFLNDDRHHLAVAIDNGRVVGMASGVTYVHPDKPLELWINEAGVAPAARGAGVGKRLLQALFAHGRALGCREAWVLTEHDNVAANRLYRSVGGTGAPVVIYSFGLDDLRDSDTGSAGMR